MKHSEFSSHRLFLHKGKEYIRTDIGTRTIIAVLSGLTCLLMFGAGAAVGSHFSSQLRKRNGKAR